MSATDRDLARAILREMVADGVADRALQLWGERTGLGACQQMQRVLRIVATDAINTVLARRLSEAARTGPWEGGHHFQEEDGYPGSLLPQKRGEP